MAARRSRKKPTRTKSQREFVSEAEEILERMRAELSDLADQSARGRDFDPDLVNGLFRGAHSLKGLAGMFGFDALSELAHHLEDVLDGVRLGRLRIGGPAVELLEEAVALFAELLVQVGDAVDEDAVAGSVRTLVERTDRAVRDDPAEAEDDLARLDLDPALLRALTEYEEHRLRDNLRRGRHLALVDSTFEILSFEDGLSELSAAIKEVGEVVSTLPSPGEAPESQIRFSLLVAAQVGAEELSARLDFPDTSVRAVQGESGAAREAPRRAHPNPEARPPPSVGPEPDIESLKSISDTVRVDVRKLDELMNLVGELAIQRSSIASVADRLSSETATARLGSELSKVHKVLERKLKELQTSVLDVRMVPLRQVFEKLSRVARRLRRDLEKDVRLEFKGADTELDKLTVEELVDPLMHVVRNAFDHAIEPPEERVAAGKTPHGVVRIEASQRGNHVLIQVSDDGRGIDRDDLRERAEARGLVERGEALSPKEILDLVFAAGFTTREQVSETSGRGVGMDVVRSNITALGGIVELDSSLGAGTCVTMTLPITLAIIQALLVGVGEQRFAIPLNAVLETMLVDDSMIQRSETRELLNLRGEPLPLRRLASEFGLDAPRPDKQFAVVLGLGELRLGLLVDRLDGQQDMVIKPIRGPIPQVRGIAGATEIGDHGATLVLDVSALVEEAVRRREVA